MPQISVVIPAYNSEKYLRECLDSIKAQTFTDWECLVVDDGSKDSTPDIVQEYAAADRRFRLLRQANAGAYMARVTGVEAAQGEWIAFIDSDDTVDSVYLQRLHSLADDTTDIVISNPDYSIIGREQLSLMEYRKATFVCFPVSPSVCFKLFRRSLFKGIKKAHPAEFRFAEDATMNIRLSFVTDKPVKVHPEFHYRVRHRPDSVSNSFQPTPDYFETIRAFLLDIVPEKEREAYKPYGLQGRISALEPHCGYKVYVEPDWWDSDLRRGITRDLKAYGQGLPWIHRQLLTYRNPWLRRPLILLRKVYNKLQSLPK
ncbi:MAG: glycosyltransferase family 2 protein [Candidatus Amulumruptor caecigallinarius]|nr:glycosyltransferase family 2 protein [Candidatus Amulumruptor caecigallinarius]MCM1395943.1 glycosyltransferase family 2 protein [Candidatus Amulumruptor caecigallinarius]MCM1452978.1 glycosyltransferase family 2 protein [bacterium]